MFFHLIKRPISFLRLRLTIQKIGKVYTIHTNGWQVWSLRRYGSLCTLLRGFNTATILRNCASNSIWWPIPKY